MSTPFSGLTARTATSLGVAARRAQSVRGKAVGFRASTASLPRHGGTAPGRRDKESGRRWHTCLPPIACFLCEDPFVQYTGLA